MGGFGGVVAPEPWGLLHHQQTNGGRVAVVVN